MYRRTDTVHLEFTDFLNRITPRSKDIELLADAVARAARDRAHNTRSLSEKRQRETERLAEQQSQLIRLKTEKMISDEEFVAHRTMLARQQMEIDSLPVNTIYREKQRLSDLAIITEPLQDLAKTWHEISPVLQMRFQHSILPAGFIVGRIGTADMSCLFSCFQRSRLANSHVVPPTGEFWNQLEKEIKAFAVLFRKDVDEVVAA